MYQRIHSFASSPNQKNPLITPQSLSLLCVLSASFWFGSCNKADNSIDHRTNGNYQPKGDLSDLVYNPLREDGTIDSSYLPVLTFETTIYDFGTIFEGDVVRQNFAFKNTGTAPLLITNGSSTCGCTVPEWPEKPIPVDSTGSITVKFDSKGKTGDQSKEVTIFANTYPNKSILTIKGKVTKTNQ